MKTMIEGLSTFTREAYSSLIVFLKSSYRIATVSEAYSTKRCLMLRHDVDVSLESALTMAGLDSELGVKSTFYVLFSNRHYNLLDKDSLRLLWEISALGHEVGLHYDLEAYRAYGTDVLETLEREIGLLGRLAGGRVASVAPHNPSKNDPLLRRACVNAYDSGLCDLYVSDSSRAWDLKSLNALLSLKHDRVQLLTHPFLWTEKACDLSEFVEDYLRRRGRREEAYFRELMETWENRPKNRAYNASLRG